MKRFAEFAISLALAGLILYVLLGRFDLRQTMQSVSHARMSLLIIGIALMVAAYLLRGARWPIWERSLSYWNSLRLILIGFMGNNILPTRLGELLRAHCAAAKTAGGRGRTAALASIAAERVLDGSVLGVFGLVAIGVIPLDRRLQWILFMASLAFALLAAGLALGARQHERVRFLISAVTRRFPGRMTAVARDKITYMLDGIIPLGRWPRMLAAVGVTAVIWGFEMAACYFIGRAVWDGMSMRTALLFLVVVCFASLVPLTMGGIGTIEAAGPIFLVSSGVVPHLALAMVFLQHAGQYFFTTVTGGVLYLAGGFHRISLLNPKAAPRPFASLAPPAGSEEPRLNPGQPGSSVELKRALRSEIDLSIVIPAYNEQARLPRTVRETIRWCSARSLTFEIIIVDDGSRDETLALARVFEEGDTRIRVLARPHLGKGAAVRLGMLNAKGSFALFMDADGATPLHGIPKLLAAIEQGHDVAIGSRASERPRGAKVKALLHRRFIGRTFAFLVNLLAVGGIADTQCGFKMFRQDAAAAIFSRQKTPGFAFDVEILFIARRLMLSIAEVPVNWIAQPGSKVNLVIDSIGMLWDVSRIRWLHRNLHAGPALAPVGQPGRQPLARQGAQAGRGASDLQCP